MNNREQQLIDKLKIGLQKKRGDLETSNKSKADSHAQIVSNVKKRLAETDPYTSEFERLKTEGLNKLGIESRIIVDAKAASDYLKRLLTNPDVENTDTQITTSVSSINRITHLLLFLYYVLNEFKLVEDKSINLEEKYRRLRHGNKKLPKTLFLLISAILTSYSSIKHGINEKNIKSDEILQFFISSTKLFYAFISYLNDFNNTNNVSHGNPISDDFNKELIPTLDPEKLSKNKSVKIDIKNDIKNINSELTKNRSVLRGLIDNKPKKEAIYKNINTDAFTIKDKINKLRERVNEFQQGQVKLDELEKRAKQREKERNKMNANENSDEFTMDDRV